MGTSTILDIITSAVMAGVLLLIALRLNAQANESTTVYNGSVILQQNITTLVGWIEHDFRQIGYCRDWTKIPKSSDSFRRADTSDITFWTDVNNAGNKDSIRWYIGGTNDNIVNQTPNPNDRLIYRVVNNGTPKGWNLGVTQFRLRYFRLNRTEMTAPVSSPDEIYEIQISIACQSPYKFSEQWRASAGGTDSVQDFQVFWRQLRLAARNLKSR
ncbi:MAG: hypothetical protein NTU47_14770 [Ignavibacteriales bacterium]|nr:hypothetical protein [Ignavibacteriales bacterium]